ncbi:MAG: HypC/HybG/HupF family hydrogenase formation chaperone [Ktedonobacterales bacterium]|nr:HypC/HybG/HupF family hydrogenase formation chaperone [Ktedonobacterales bacterium]
MTDTAAHMAAIRISGARRTVDISLVDDEGIAPGEWVLVHADLALSKMAEREALETLALLREMSDAFLGDAPGYAAPASASPQRRRGLIIR